MPEETLNIDYHTRHLVVKALNVKPTHSQAAAVLGICYRTLLRKMRQYNIKKVDGEYQIIEKQKQKLIK